MQTAHVICFRRQNGTFFAVREFDTKFIKKQVSVGGEGPSEQAHRAAIRQAILNMKLNMEPATKVEIQYLKNQGALGKRAPSCSLLTGEDMMRLLHAFNQGTTAERLANALSNTPAVDTVCVHKLTLWPVDCAIVPESCKPPAQIPAPSVMGANFVYTGESRPPVAKKPRVKKEKLVSVVKNTTTTKVAKKPAPKKRKPPKIDLLSKAPSSQKRKEMEVHTPESRPLKKRTVSRVSIGGMQGYPEFPNMESVHLDKPELEHPFSSSPDPGSDEEYEVELPDNLGCESPLSDVSESNFVNLWDHLKEEPKDDIGLCVLPLPTATYTAVRAQKEHPATMQPVAIEPVQPDMTVLRTSSDPINTGIVPEAAGLTRIHSEPHPCSSGLYQTSVVTLVPPVQRPAFDLFPSSFFQSVNNASMSDWIATM